jgi:D-alanyl-D-alanine carboxypeptidase (penicillin-binding protein 5/6)
MHLIAVIMGAPTRDARNTDARTLLDYGFANWALYSDPETDIEGVPVIRGEKSLVMAYSKPFSLLVKKSDLSKIEKAYTIPESISAPFNQDAKIGEIIYKLNGTSIGKTDICAREGVDTLGYFEIIWRIMKMMLTGKTL